MAGNDNADRVQAVGETQSAKSLGMADRPRDLGLGSSLAVGNLEQSPPYTDLEWRAAQVESNGELLEFARRVGLKLSRNLAIFLR